jgi:ABC-2 type transport system permease protein
VNPLARAQAVLGVYYAQMVEYRAELVLWALSNSLSFILMGVWYQATTRGSFAVQPIDVVRYFLAVFVVRQLTVVWVIWEVEQDMQRGRLAHFLLAPLDPVWRYVALHVAERLARLPFSAMIVAAFFLLYRPAFFVPDAVHALEAAGFVVVAFALRFLIQYTFALLSFWTERATSVEQLVFIVYMFLSGAVAPLDVFPPAVKDAVMLTPFPYLIWVPARLIVGGTDIDVARAALVCGAWFLGLLVVNRLVWARGLKRFSAQGA